VKDGNLYSARGLSDGIQMALALVREDFGREFARSIAQSLSRRHQ
jgi:transcriptional regulator GlxA family with amidase domain